MVKEEKLIRAEKISSLNSLVTSIAHEINNPMAIISGNIQIIESKSGADSTEKKRFNVVQDAIHRIETLISDMNFLTTIKDMTILNFSFSALLSRVANQIIPEDIKLKIEGCDEDNINSNQNMVTICVENVLRNSVDSIKGRDIDGEISIRYYWADTFFVIEITDNGGGIEEPDRIFEPFYTTFSDKRGLGLTFVFHAIQALNGEISVENFKNGTRVTLKLIRLSPD